MRLFSVLVPIMTIAGGLLAAQPQLKLEGQGENARATLESDVLKLVFQPKGGKCVSFVVKTPGGELELTDKTGLFEDHLSTQSYLKSDFRRARFEMKADGEALLLSAEATSPEVAGLTLSKRITFSNARNVVCSLSLTNAAKEIRNVGLWHHQAAHTSDGSTKYFIPTENGIVTLSYDPKGQPSEQWFRNPSRNWLGVSAGDKNVAALAFITDWTNLDHTFCYRSDLYATLEWRTLSKRLLPGESFETTYQVLAVPEARAIHGILLQSSVIDASGVEARILPPAAGSVAAVAARGLNDRLAIPAGTAAAAVIQIKWPEGLTADNGVIVVTPADARPFVHRPEFSPAGKPFRMEPAPFRLAAQKTLPAGRQDMLYSIDVPWSVTPWGTPYYRGTLKAWILSPIVPNGDTVSLLKRFDIDYDIVSCDWSWEMNTWGMGDAYGKRSAKDASGRDLEFGYATEDLTSDKHYDLLILPTLIGWNQYPEKMRQAIVKRVEAGAGLVLIDPQDCKEKPADQIALPKLSPFVGAAQTQYHWYGDWQRHHGLKGPAEWKVSAGQAQHPLVSGVCWQAMPLATAVAFRECRLAEGATAICEAGGTPTIATKTVGKGRVVAINWSAGQGASLTPVEDEKKAPSWDYWEQFYNLLGRACLYAAQREPEVDVALAAFKAPSLSVKINNRLRPLQLGLRTHIKDERGRLAGQIDAPLQNCPVGETTLEIVLPALPGGTNHIEVMAHSAGYPVKLAWAATQITIPKSAEVTAVSVTPEALKNGEELKGDVTTKGNAGAGKLRIELRDPFERILDLREENIEFTGELKKPYQFKVDNALSLVVFVRAQIIVGNSVVSEKDSADVVVTPPEPAFLDYEVVPWGFTSRRDLWPVKAAQLKKFFTTSTGKPSPRSLRHGFVAKGEAHPPRNTLGVYYYDSEKGELEKKWNKYKETGDKTVLKRQVCIADPELLKKVEAEIRKKVREQKKFNPGSYFIGDESSLTSYGMELDLDFNPTSLQKFREWLTTRYGDIAKLNAKWQTEFKDFAAIVPFTIVEVEKDAKKACGWAEHRTFQEETYENVLRLIRETGKQEDPNAEFELTGTQAATSFNGIDWARHTRHVKRFVPYNIHYSFDQLRCFNPGVKMFALTGYGSHGEGVKHSLWNQALHGLLSANIFWEWSVIDADLTLSQNAEDIGAVFGELRGQGIGRLLNGCTWAKSPVAIHYSMPSIHAARVQKREAFPHHCRDAWCSITRNLGLQFDMLSYFQIEEGSWLKDPPQVLVLPAALALSAKEAQAFIQYVENGGTLIADVDPGICDERCDFRENKLLEKLFGDGKTAGLKSVGKGKAILLSHAFADYGKVSGQKRGAEIRAEVAKLFADAGLSPSVPVSVNGTSLEHAEIILMRYSALQVLAILKDNLSGIRRTTPDGVEYFEPLPAGQTLAPEKITAKLPGSAHVYDIRARKYLGKVESIEDELRSAEAKLYALLPYQVQRLNLATNDRFAPSSALHIVATIHKAQDLRPQEQTLPLSDHVFNVKVVGQDGKQLDYYSRNILAEKGQATIILPVEKNSKGPFKLIVTDVATGVKGEYDFAK